MRSTYYLLLLAFCSTLQAAAQLSGQIETDRPDQTESSFLVPKKWFQAELGLQVEKEADGTRQFIHPTLLSKYGLGKRLELRLITEWLSDEAPMTIPYGNTVTTGILPVQLGVKIGLLEEKGWIPKTSLIAHTTIPMAASKQFEQKLWGPNFRFTMQNNISDKMRLGYNVGAEWDGKTDIPVWLYTFAPGFDLGEKWGAYVEAFGFFAKGHAPQHLVDGGLTFLVNNNMQLDLAGGFGLSDTAPKNFMTLGLSFRFR